MDFHGKHFCGIAYADFRSGLYAFYAIPLRQKDDPYGRALILTDLSRRTERLVRSLRSQDAIRVSGIIDSSESCSDASSVSDNAICAPISHPVFIERPEVSTVQTDNGLPTRSGS
jgi:hypothetical protein